MSEGSGTWGNYSKLVLKELVRLNEELTKAREDMGDTFKELDTKIAELNYKLSELKNIENKVESHVRWIERTNEIWSSTQMKEAKDEIYKQKNRWVAAIAILLVYLFGVN